MVAIPCSSSDCDKSFESSRSIRLHISLVTRKWRKEMTVSLSYFLLASSWAEIVAGRLSSRMSQSRSIFRGIWNMTGQDTDQCWVGWFTGSDGFKQTFNNNKIERLLVAQSCETVRVFIKIWNVFESWLCWAITKLVTLHCMTEWLRNIGEFMSCFIQLKNAFSFSNCLLFTSI